MVFSEVHDWNDNTAVKQILVFGTLDAMTNFFNTYKIEKVKNPDISVKDIPGCVYMFRAVRDSDGRRVPIIRCGATGILLNELRPVDTCQDAFKILKESFVQDQKSKNYEKDLSNIIDKIKQVSVGEKTTTDTK